MTSDTNFLLLSHVIKKVALKQKKRQKVAVPGTQSQLWAHTMQSGRRPVKLKWTLKKDLSEPLET